MSYKTFAAGLVAHTPHGQLLRETCTALLGTSPQYLIHGLLADDTGVKLTERGQI